MVCCACGCVVVVEMSRYFCLVCLLTVSVVCFKEFARFAKVLCVNYYNVSLQQCFFIRDNKHLHETCLQHTRLLDHE